MQSTSITIPADGRESVDLGGLGITWKIDGAETGERFSIVHHPLAPRALAAPLHRHSREDEYSYVLEGTLGALLGDEVVTAGPGTWVFKPRDQWHTFWNDGDTPLRDHRGDLPRGLRALLPRARRGVRAARPVSPWASSAAATDSSWIRRPCRASASASASPTRSR